MGVFGFGHLPARSSRRRNRAKDVSHDAQRIGVVLRIMIGHSGDPAMHVGSAKLFRRDFLSCSGFDQRRPAQKDRTLVANDNRLVAHGRHIGAAGRARAHNSRNLVETLGRHPRLVVENPAKVVAIRKYLGLQRQECAA